MIGEVVGQYKILEKLGEGGMGAVYKGIDTMVEREVAIKMLRPEIARQPELVERFRTEAITLAKLNSPGIATLYNFFRQGDDYFMVMEFVAGQTLDRTIRETGAMPWDKAVSLCCHILECIQPAHNAGILHRDIKPANIMLTPWGGVKVMDFGIARVLGSSRMTREGLMVGTLEYIAPERVTGQEADARADIYSMGVVLYELLSGRLPFENTSEFAIMRGHVQETPPPFAQFVQHGPHVPPAIEAAVMKALAKVPADRFQSCSDFIGALQAAVREGHPAGLATSAHEKAFDFDRLKPTAFLSQVPGLGMSMDSAPTVAAQVPTAFAPHPPQALAPEPPPSRIKAMLIPALGACFAILVISGFFLFRSRSTDSPRVIPPPPSQAQGVSAVRAPVEPSAKPSPFGPAAAKDLPGGKAPAKTDQAPDAPPAVQTPEPPAPPTLSQPGIYVKKGDQWVALLAEGVSWKKTGVIKKSMVGAIPGEGSPNKVQNPVEFVISTPEGVAITDYSLVAIRQKKGVREIRVTADGPDSKSVVPFSAKRLGGRNYQIDFSQGEGEYVFLPPRSGVADTDGAPPPTQRLYTFRVR